MNIIATENATNILPSSGINQGVESLRVNAAHVQWNHGETSRVIICN